ncbi:MAG: hypothetical protein KDB80_16705 [Planctomycetes bacterium]|nr:hypothetical protein [Planctomycetota bacterium]
MNELRSLIVLAAALLTTPLAAQSKELEAAKELARAVEAASKGKYERAVGTYKKIARQYPETGAGEVALARSQTTAFLGQADVVRNGPSSNRVDVVMMGDGYRLGDQNDFDDVAKSVPKVFEKHKLLGEYFAYHNFVRANLRSTDQGVSGFGREKDTALGGFVAGKVQGQVGVDRAKVHGWLAEIEENDGLVIAIVKAGSLGTGGAGIAAIGGRADDTLVHEWGHAFGGLSDEYTTFTGHRGPARDTINIAAKDDPAAAPWAHFIEQGIPGVGMYRGGDGRIKGVWRPTASGCAMAGGQRFCPVCREAIVLRIHRHVDPIDAHEPANAQPIAKRGKLTFEVTVMQPKSHELHSTWYVLGGQDKIRPTAPGPFADRRQRGKLAAIDARPADGPSSPGSARRRFSLDTGDLEPGIYQVVCRVEDRAKPSGQQHPWVLKDDDQLMWSERVWDVVVK